MKQKGWLCGVLVGFSFCLFGCACEGVSHSLRFAQRLSRVFQVGSGSPKGQRVAAQRGALHHRHPEEGRLEGLNF